MEILVKGRSKPWPWAHILYIVVILALAAGFIHLYLENNRLAENIGRLKKSRTVDRVVVFFADPQKDDFKIKPYLCPVKSPGDKHLQALQILLDGPAPGTGLMKLFPTGTKVISFSLQNGLATVNFNRRIMELNVGSTLEALAVVSIVNTLTKFPDVYRVKILIEGKEVESLAGHVDLTTELRYSEFGVDPFPEELK